MGQPTEASVFPGDVFNPAMHSPILRFLKKHLGKTPTNAGFDRGRNHPDLGRPVDAAAAYVALRRFWEEKQERGDKGKNGMRPWEPFKAEIVTAIESQIEFERIMDAQTEKWGSRDYGSQGIGLAAGQSPRCDFLGVEMSPQQLPPGRDITQHLRDRQAIARGDVEAPVAAPVVISDQCPYCDRGFKNIGGVHLHVKGSHPDNYGTDWPSMREDMKTAKAARKGEPVAA